MHMPAIQGIIDRRLLVNFRVDPAVMARNLPEPFRPLLHNDLAIAGICLIRLTHIRPKGMPAWCGIRSENAAHRIAVEWDDAGETRQGVYIPRRDTNSCANHLAGGRIFPGEHHLARFTVEESDTRFCVSLDSDDDATHVSVEGDVTDTLPHDSVFASLDEASDFFEAGSLGYSATSSPGTYDGMELDCRNWRVEALAVSHVASSYFIDTSRFPDRSVAFDHALLMRGIEHEWHSHPPLCCAAQA